MKSWTSPICCSRCTAGKTISRDSHDQTRGYHTIAFLSKPSKLFRSQSTATLGEKVRASGRCGCRRPPSRREHLFNAVFIYNPNITRKLRQRRPNRPWRGRRPPTHSPPPPRRGARWEEPSNVKCHQLVSVSPAIFSISPIVSDGRADEATHASRRRLRGGGEAGLTGLILIARGRSVARFNSIIKPERRRREK